MSCAENRFVSWHFSIYFHSYSQKFRSISLKFITEKRLSMCYGIKNNIYAATALFFPWSLPQDLNQRQYRKRCLAARRWDRPWCQPMHPARSTWVCIAGASREPAIFAQHTCRIYLSRTIWPLKTDSALFFRDAGNFIAATRDIEWDKVWSDVTFLWDFKKKLVLSKKLYNLSKKYINLLWINKFY